MKRVFFLPPRGWGSGEGGQKIALQGITKHIKQRFLPQDEFPRTEKYLNLLRNTHQWKGYRSLGTKEGDDHEAKFTQQEESGNLVLTNR